MAVSATLWTTAVATVTPVSRILPMAWSPRRRKSCSSTPMARRRLWIWLSSSAVFWSWVSLSGREAPI